MKRLVCGLAALCIVSLVAPAFATAQAPTDDFVVAEGAEPAFGFALDITARSGPSGENPTGRVFYKFPGSIGPAYTGEVTCLRVSGNAAIVGFVGTVIGLLPVVPVAGVIRLTDGGGPGSLQDIFERPLSLDQFPPPTLAPDCSTFPATNVVRRFFFPSDDLTGEPLGDIVVHDAPAVPTSTRECKNGGWKTYGVFKNQGDCVSFVATKGKNPPAGSTP